MPKYKPETVARNIEDRLSFTRFVRELAHSGGVPITRFVVDHLEMAYSGFLEIERRTQAVSENRAELNLRPIPNDNWSRLYELCKLEQWISAVEDLIGPREESWPTLPGFILRLRIVKSGQSKFVDHHQLRASCWKLLEASEKFYERNLENRSLFGLEFTRDIEIQPEVKLTASIRRRRRMDLAVASTSPQKNKRLFDALSSSQDAILLGDPGSAKTTLILNYLIEVCERRCLKGDKTIIPLYISATLLSQCISDSADNLNGGVGQTTWNIIWNAACKTSGEELTNVATAVFLSDLAQLTQVEFAICVDGLDELYSLDELKKTINWLGHLRDHYEGSRFQFITALRRIPDLGLLEKKGATVYEILPLTSPQIKKIAILACDSQARVESPGETLPVERVQSFLEKSCLAKNPRTLSIALNVIFSHPKLIQSGDPSLAELYGYFLADRVSIFFDTAFNTEYEALKKVWFYSSGVRLPEITKPDVIKMLSCIAICQQAGYGSKSSAVIINELLLKAGVSKSAWRNYDYCKKDKNLRVSLGKFLSKTGLISPPSDVRVGLTQYFYDNSFRQYLAADLAIKSGLDNHLRIWKRMIMHWADPSWQEFIYFFFDLFSGDPLKSQLLCDIEKLSKHDARGVYFVTNFEKFGIKLPNEIRTAALSAMWSYAENWNPCREIFEPYQSPDPTSHVQYFLSPRYYHGNFEELLPRICNKLCPQAGKAWQETIFDNLDVKLLKSLARNGRSKVSIRLISVAALAYSGEVKIAAQYLKNIINTDQFQNRNVDSLYEIAPFLERIELEDWDRLVFEESEIFETGFIYRACEALRKNEWRNLKEYIKNNRVFLNQFVAKVKPVDAAAPYLAFFWACLNKFDEFEKYFTLRSQIKIFSATAENADFLAHFSNISGRSFESEIRSWALRNLRDENLGTNSLIKICFALVGVSQRFEDIQVVLQALLSRFSTLKDSAPSYYRIATLILTVNSYAYEDIREVVKESLSKQVCSVNLNLLCFKYFLEAEDYLIARIALRNVLRYSFQDPNKFDKYFDRVLRIISDCCAEQLLDEIEWNSETAYKLSECMASLGLTERLHDAAKKQVKFKFPVSKLRELGATQALVSLYRDEVLSPDNSKIIEEEVSRLALDSSSLAHEYNLLSLLPDTFSLETR